MTDDSAPANALPDDALEFAQSLFDAARDGNSSFVISAVDQGVPVDLTDASGNSLLMLAAYHGHADLVALLADRGADIDRQNDRLQSPLAGAVFKRVPAVINVLIARGADPHAGVPTAIAAAEMFGVTLPGSAQHTEQGDDAPPALTPNDAERSTDDDGFLADWAELSRFGAVGDSGGVDRQAATETDGAQRTWFAALLERHGFSVHRDAIGNQFGLLEIVPGAPYVLTGSHLDSQPTAGRFDGAYGVLASAYACFRVAAELRADPSRARYNLAVVNWFNEEGSRFQPSLMGSSVFTGALPLNTALATRDRQGTSVREALDALGERGDFAELEIASYAEVHVQQGRSMEENGVTIGLVHATWGARKFEFRVTGEQAHSGATAMVDRRDALLGAARLIVFARELADRFPPGMLHTACGEITVYPNSPVVVASEALLLFDLRSPSTEVLDAAYAAVQEAVERVRREVGVDIDVVAEHRWDQNSYPESGVQLAQAVAEELGLSHDRVMTIAGHDSTVMKEAVPTIMLFVPSVNGVSHNLREYTRDGDLISGLAHLTGVVRRLSQGALAGEAPSAGRDA